MSRQLKVRLEGGDAHLGDVPAFVVARLLLGIERAVADAATQILGRQPGLTGRKGGTVEAATRLKLVAIREGSVMPVFELPDVLPSEGDLDVIDEHLGLLALESTLSTITGEAEDPHVAGALADLADELGIGSRYERVTLDDYRGTHRIRTAVIDGQARTRLRLVGGGGLEKKNDAVVGTVFEADFEKNTARVRTAQRRSVSVRFSDEHADKIQEALRHQTQLVGRVTYDEKTGEALRVDVQRVTRTEQLLLDVEHDDFWRDQPVHELIAQRDAPPAAAASAIVDDEASDAEIDAFFAALELDA